MSAALEPALADPPARARWADLRLRALSAIVLIPLVLLCVWLGGWPFDALLAAALLGVAWEWAAMCRWSGLPLALGLSYAAASVASLWWLRAAGLPDVVLVLVVVWCSDIGAYAVGRLVGGPRLASSISPGKTWSGAFGGLAAAVVGGMCVTGVTVWGGAAAALLGVASQLGDLGESALKRHYGVKDSGRLIPGHGGLLDRVDGLMAAALVCGAIMASGLAFAGPGLPAR